MQMCDGNLGAAELRRGMMEFHQLITRGVRGGLGRAGQDLHLCPLADGGTA